jgi:hypothetical protein
LKPGLAGLGGASLSLHYFQILSMSWLDSIINIKAFVNDSATATWRKSPYIAAIQWVIIGISLIDFSVYTLNFLYGLYLAFRSFKGFEKLTTILVALVFLSVRFLYLPFLLSLVPLDGMYLFPDVIYLVSFVGLLSLYFVLLVLPLFFSVGWAWKYKLWRNNNRMDPAFISKVKRRMKKRNKKSKIANMVLLI